MILIARDLLLGFTKLNIFFITTKRVYCNLLFSFQVLLMAFFMSRYLETFLAEASKIVYYNQSRISRAERHFNYDVIDSHAVGCNSNKQNDPIDDALRGHHALASLPAGI